MKTPARPLQVDVDPLTAAALLGGVSGGLAIPLPYFVSLTVALGALATLIFSLRRLRGRRQARGRAVIPSRRLRGGVGLVVAGWGAFLAAPIPMPGVHAALLGTALVGVWLMERAERPVSESGWA